MHGTKTNLRRFLWASVMSSLSSFPEVLLRNTDRSDIYMRVCVCVCMLIFVLICECVCVQALKLTTISHLLQGDYCDQSNIALGPVCVCVCVLNVIRPWKCGRLPPQPAAFWPMESGRVTFFLPDLCHWKGLRHLCHSHTNVIMIYSCEVRDSCDWSERSCSQPPPTDSILEAISR